MKQDALVAAYVAEARRPRPRTLHQGFSQACVIVLRELRGSSAGKVSKRRNLELFE